MPLIATRGAASVQGFGEFAQSAAVNYIEDVFQTWLYTGNDSVQTITNGVDLAGKGGLIWLKKRNNTSIHGLWDTVRGGTKRLSTESTNAESTLTDAFTFNSNGFTIPAGGSSYLNESSLNTYVSWTFREQPKFFDVVTYTGNGSAGRTVSHNLGSVPGVIVVKSLTTSGYQWTVYHRSLGNTKAVFLDSTEAESTSTSYWNNTTPTSTQFSVGTSAYTNSNGENYVAYLFAHDAGGFGLTGLDNVITCGSLTITSGVATATLGYEPQFLLIKNTSIGTWWILDNMRGMPVGSNDPALGANSSSAEASLGGTDILSTGFTMNSDTWGAGTFIYIAIRRGPMKTPTSGADVYNADTFGGGPPGFQSGFVTDFAFYKDKDTSPYDWFVSSRLTSGQFLKFNTNGAESASVSYDFDYMNGWFDSSSSDSTIQSWMFRRAPGFMDVVCYTGTGSATTFNHNLGVAPELMIVKSRSTASTAWMVYASGPGPTKHSRLNTTNSFSVNSAIWNDTAPTSSVFTVGTDSDTNGASRTFVAYLFATCAGVSKVGTYTGTGSTQTINCGFTAGSRFVLIKRTDSTGDWYVWDSARGIVAGNDPYLLLNSTAAEVTTTDWVDTANSGFELSSAVGNNVNINNATYIFLAIA
jgi:hypothetical protein